MEDKIYILIECVERDIQGIKYDTFEEAHAAMEECYNEIINTYGYEDSEITEWYAWINDGPNHDNYDWKIVDVKR